ncbi:MAG TPA: competence protein ComK [Pseudogracilibacillus sp.]|nr:competence protein ComK [Pseudogracilibacillus sp.]
MFYEDKATLEISPLTMAVLPKEDETGKTSTIILEKSGKYSIPSSPTDLIDLACRYFGSSLEGRLEGTKEVSQYTHKAPIAIDPLSGMFFFPTTSPKNRNCSWINHSHVDMLERVGHDKTKVIFNDGSYIIVDVSYGSMSNQLQRTAQFRFFLEKRLRKIHSSVNKQIQPFNPFA